MIALLVTVAVTSLVGSLHCAGMCGPFVLFYSGGDSSRGLRRLLSHAAYGGGRLLAYLALGLAAGALGAALDLASSLAGIQRLAAVVAGAVMVVWGVLALLRTRGVSLLGPSTGTRAHAWLRRGFSLAAGRPPVVRAGLVGVLSGALPCGWLWAFLVTAAGTGRALPGAAVMAAFWLGTVPVLLAVGLGGQLVGSRVRRAAPALAAALMVVLGLVAIVSRPASAAAVVARQEARAAESPAEGGATIPDADHTCCGGGR